MNHRFLRFALLTLSVIVSCATVVPTVFDQVRAQQGDSSTLFLKQRHRTGGTPIRRQEEANFRQELRQRYHLEPSDGLIADALLQKRELTGKHLLMQFRDERGNPMAIWDATPAHYAPWITLLVTPWSARYELDEQAIQTTLATEVSRQFAKQKDALILSLEKRLGHVYANVQGIAKDGYAFAIPSIAHEIRMGLERGKQSLNWTLPRAPGHIFNATGFDLGTLSLLASGHSNFAGSGEGRKANVRKGLQENLQNVLIAPGEDFSFNSVLGSVTLSEGWQLALAIFNGHSLLMVPGGGLCQVATTVYRAAILAGLPILERSNHSLYVHYYALHGIGIDATIYPGRKDLVFRNDTGHSLLLQAYADGEEAFVNVYGTPDGRSVQLRGPYIASMNSSIKPKLHANDIGWVRTVHYDSGKEVNEAIVSRYNALPRTIDTILKDPRNLPRS
ncbi:VanW family protein [Candidatus Peregrinibacteria bacterium]|nr:VanW family protein [Candidatus Peregrinibacteria bacterium]MBI3817006.1 VanW family protein [Candidatus Peregrinibacteria bacterium]